MRGTFLITSGAYAGPDFISTFGLLPPAFLPVGNRRLYELHAELTAGTNSRKLLSVPEDFMIEVHERARLTALGFDIIPVTTGISLGASIGQVLETGEVASGKLEILHGDTYIFGLPTDATDIVSEGASSDYYAWAEYRLPPSGEIAFFDGLMAGQSASRSGARPVLSGYFCFADANLYRAALAASDCEFVPSLNEYSKTRPLQPVSTGRWLDFGHLDRYYKSRTDITTERAFNSMDISRRSVRKSSNDAFKMTAEKDWFKSVPETLKTFTPQFLGTHTDNGRTGYEIEHLFLSPLSDLHVFGRLPTFVWQRIFQSCDAFLTACRGHPPDNSLVNCEVLYLEKTLARLDLFSQQSGTSLSDDWRYAGQLMPGLQNIAEQCAKAIPAASQDHLQFMHGDFCFSNIFYDFRADTIRVVDPRGYVADGHPTIYGDIRYDIAKLYHSVIGEYDTIISGFYALEGETSKDLVLNFPQTTQLLERQAVFRQRAFGGIGIPDSAAEPISVLLFLSMLPLHEDRPDRQRAFLANALRLFQGLDT